MLTFVLLLVQAQAGAGTRLSPLRNLISECLLLKLMGNSLTNHTRRRMGAFFMLYHYNYTSRGYASCST